MNLIQSESAEWLLSYGPENYNKIYVSDALP